MNLPGDVLSPHAPKVGGGAGAGVAGTLYPDITISNTRTSTSPCGVNMTGTGLNTRPNCGTFRTMIVCQDHPNEHHTKKVRSRNCKNLACPECWPFRARELAETASGRLWGYYWIKHGATPRQIVFSMPRTAYPAPNMEPEELVKTVRTWGMKMAKLAGITAAVIVPHIYRIKKEYQRLFNEEAKRVNKENREGREIKRKENRYTILLKLKNWRDYIDYSPHAHVIGYGFLMNAKAFYKATGGIVYKTGRPLKDCDAVAAVIYYLLSHASPVENVQVLTYFGDVSYNKLLCVDEKKIEEPASCPDCGAPWIYDDSKEPYFYKRIYRVYELKGTGEQSPVYGQQELIGAPPPGGTARIVRRISERELQEAQLAAGYRDQWGSL